MNLSVNYSIFPLGDSAITIDLGNDIDNQINRKVLAIHDWLQMHRFEGVIDIIVGYSSVSLFYDPAIVRSGKDSDPAGAYSYCKRLLETAWTAIADSLPSDGGTDLKGATGGSPRFLRIPVCYEREYGPDLEQVAREKNLTGEEIIRLHCSSAYHVYMIGFLPGFAYMGKTDPRLHIPRKPQPVPVTAGGVGIAGIQTGIYPLNSPGGWQIIGRTPSKLFTPDDDPPVRLQAGDKVQFYPISRDEFSGWKDT